MIAHRLMLTTLFMLGLTAVILPSVTASELVLGDLELWLAGGLSSFDIRLDPAAGDEAEFTLSDDFDLVTDLRLGWRQAWNEAGASSSIGVGLGGIISQRWSDSDRLDATGVWADVTWTSSWANGGRWWLGVTGQGQVGEWRFASDRPFRNPELDGWQVGYGVVAGASLPASERWLLSLDVRLMQTEHRYRSAVMDVAMREQGVYLGIGLSWRGSLAPRPLESR